MKAIALEEFGPPENFQIKEVPLPEINDDEVLVKIKAISINPVDTYIRKGIGFASRYQFDNYLIIGWDVAGIVERKGQNITRFKEGDEVFGMVRFPENGQAYAEYVAAPAAHLAQKPANIGFEEAAASTLAALTAWQALVHNGNLQNASVNGENRQKVLIHAASGGVGHFAVQMAKHFGAYVVGTSSVEKKDFVLELGADKHIDYQNQNFEEIVDDADLVLDAVGGENSYRSIKAVKKGGLVITILSIATDLPEKAEKEDKKGKVMLVSTSGEDIQQISNLLEKNAIKSHIFHSYPFDQMAEAHKQVETRRTNGKVVIKV